MNLIHGQFDTPQTHFYTDAMSSMLERLRHLQSLRGPRSRPEPVLPSYDADDSAGGDERTRALATDNAPWVSLQNAVDGELVENDAGVCFVSTQRYALDRPHGPRPLAAILAHQPAALATLHPNFDLVDAVGFDQAVFLDTETTGLGGASTYCFMVGVGTFEAAEISQPSQTSQTSQQPTQFVVRQFFMRNPAEEPALLTALANLLAEHAMTVTFNGRGFDLPLLRTRYQLNRRELPAAARPRLLDEGQPHLDLLLPARRVWKRRLQSCRLINLEREVLGLQRSEEDVPGHLIPYLYIDYMRSGNAGAMRRVFYHNQEDIVSMAALTDHVYHQLASTDRGVAPDELHGLDWLSLGQSYEASQRLDAAEHAYRHALETLVEPAAVAAAYGRLGDLQKRQQRWSEAAATWERWISSVPGTDATPWIELAKVYEWQLGDLEQAAMWTGWALHMLHDLQAWQRLPGQLADLEHRYARLQRKLQSRPPASRQS